MAFGAGHGAVFSQALRKAASCWATHSPTVSATAFMVPAAKGLAKARRGHKAGVGLCARAVHKGKIALPGVRLVGQPCGKELQRHRLRQAVVDIIERIFIDMQLALPARAAAIEGQALKIQPGAVFLFQPGPFGIALVGVRPGFSYTMC